MTQPYSSFGVGAELEPLPTALTNSLLRDADPALYYALDYFAYLITTFPGPRLLAQALDPQIGGLTIAKAVAQKYSDAPQQNFLSNQYAFPLLCCYRTHTLTGKFTAGWGHDRGHIEVVYALPQLTPGQLEKIGPIRKAIASTLREKTMQGFDPGYTPPGGVAGGVVWAAAGVERIGWGDPYRDNAEWAYYGHLEGAGEQLFPCIRMQGFIVERDTYISSGTKFAGGDVNIDLVTPDGAKVSNFVQASTQQPPTVTSLSVGTGPVAGGTSTTITGTLFLKAPVVLFGNTPATNVVWNSATSITCTTPAVSGAGTLGVVVVNTDGQSGFLANAFAFT
jgi:hypothetical protein